jgi:archaeal flagellin FlaB
MLERIKLIKNQKGITGLETAIILIAFVIVASVLAYVAISSGLFSSQKAKSAVNASLQQSGATIELKSNVVVKMGNLVTGNVTANVTTPIVQYGYFTVGLVPGGSSVDLTPNTPPGYVSGATPTPTVTGNTSTTTAPISQLIIGYSDPAQQVPSLYWTVNFINTNNGDYILDAGELAQITVYLEPAWYPQFMTTGLVANTTFNMDITPPDGSVLPIERKLPSRISGLINLQ